MAEKAPGIEAEEMTSEEINALPMWVQLLPAIIIGALLLAVLFYTLYWSAKDDNI